MKARFHHPGLAIVFLVCAALPAAHPAGAQESAPPPASGDVPLPFDEWVQAGAIQEIPWEVRVSPPYLRTDQRLAVDFTLRVQGPALNALGPTHELFWLVRLQNPGGDWLNSDEPGRTPLEHPLTENNELEIRLSALLLPGRYRAVVLLYDRVSAKRSLAVREFEVDPLQPDPLPEASRTLPPVEFLPVTSGWEAYFQPELKGKLWLPLETARPLEVDILLNFSVSKQYAGQLYPDFLNTRTLLGALKALTEIQMSNGTMRVAAFDLNTRRVIFEQDDVKELDWPRLRQAVAEKNPRVVSVEELLARQQAAAYFRDLLASRLRRPAGNPKRSPRRVFIVLSSYMLFPPGTDLTRVQAPPDCACRVYHLRFRLLRSNWDELEGVMKRLKPRRFEIRHPGDLRRALATILRELSKE